MKKFFAIAIISVLFASCGVIKSPVAGMIYTNVKDGFTATSNSGSSKVGTATAKGYLGIVALGDASIQAAAKEAGISRIHHVDYQALSYVGVYNVYTVIVYGE
ncbi:MAG: TRL-like family protein [Bacteroidales bacterium]